MTNRGDLVTIVNESQADASFSWAVGDALRADSPSQTVPSCEFARRGFRYGETYTIRIQSSTHHAQFTVTVQGSGPESSHTVIVERDGTIRASAEPWPVDASPCPSTTSSAA